VIVVAAVVVEALPPSLPAPLLLSRIKNLPMPRSVSDCDCASDGNPGGADSETSMGSVPRSIWETEQTRLTHYILPYSNR
jgi:hypothetical protein